jgi:hypothetical protein
MHILGSEIELGEVFTYIIVRNLGEYINSSRRVSESWQTFYSSKPATHPPHCLPAALSAQIRPGVSSASMSGGCAMRVGRMYNACWVDIYCL